MIRSTPLTRAMFVLAAFALLTAADGDWDPDWTGPGNDDDGASILSVSADGFFDAVASDGSGRVVGLITHGNNIAETTIARFTTSGAYDPSFSDDGRVLFGKSGDLGSLKWGRAMAVEPNGAVLVLVRGGRLVRLLADGSLDSAYGDDGFNSALVDVLDLPQGEYFDFTVLHRDASDGSWWVAGWVFRSDLDRNMVLVHLDAQGAVDSDFATDGVFEYDADGRYDTAETVLSDEDTVWLGGRITVTGSDFLKQGALVAVDRSGALQSDVGNQGLVVVDYGQPTEASAVSNLHLRGDGLLLAAGSVERGSALAGYHASGTAIGELAPDFAPAAVVPASVEDLAVRADGSLVLIADIDNRTDVIRLHADGSADTSFGDEGRRSYRLESNGSKTSPQSCLLTADGDLVISGTYATTPSAGVFDPWIGRLVMTDAPATSQRRIVIQLDRDLGVMPSLDDGTAGIEQAPVEWLFEGLEPISQDRRVRFQSAASN